MFYKGIIFDLDNTIYNYDILHENSLKYIFNLIVKQFNISEDLLVLNYKAISNNLKYELKSTASSHNKYIYFKQLLEYFKLPISLSDNYNDMYWEYFLDNIICFAGVKEFIIWNKNNGIKIAILTDYETIYQIKKLKKLELLDYIDIIITSEEVGIEKPSMHMFQTILNKLNLKSSEVIMIGDNYSKDIIGAINMNIFSYWFNKNNKFCDKYIEFNSFVDLHQNFIKMHKELIKFKNISKYCGERFDLVQAGGGNTSFKINDWLFIKASGYNLTNISLNDGYSVINNNKLINDINIGDCMMDVINYNVIGNNRGSIETYMHAILKKYTIHLHPIQVNQILITKNARDIINDLFPDSLFLEYITPGIKVCNEIKKKYNNECVIFLKNHGIIITTDNYDKIYEILKNVINKCEYLVCKTFNLKKYKFTNKISNYINSYFDLDNVSLLYEDLIVCEYLINKKYLFKEAITFPDALIYCGASILFLDDLLENELQEYKNKYNQAPNIIIINNNIYICGNSLNKCKDIGDVLKSNLMILDSEYKKNYLDQDEIFFLNNWDAEKIRRSGTFI